ncbi:MAG: hypothetical protein GWP08_17300, partial [Nitrospiraceae bacterium]|nr:hypothetical protein [Nitrospiraceae bacterium]
MIFELAQDFHDAVATMPRGHPRHRLLELFEEAIRRDIHFIDRHPTTLFQCMWNLCWWYDSPEAAKYYEEPEGGWSPGEPPWEQGGARQSELLDAWRCAKEMTTPGFSWIRSMRPALLSGGAIRCVLRGHACPVQHVEFAAEGRQLVSGSAHLQVQNPLPTESIWYNGKQVPVAAPAKHPYPIVDNSIRVWDAFSGRQLMCVDSADGPVRSCAVAPDGESIAYAGSAQGTVEVIEVSSGERGACFHGHRAMVNGVTFSPDGACIASASGDGTIRIREARTGADVRCLRGHRSPVMCVAFSPDGRLLVSGSRTFAAPGENALRLWDAATGETIASVDLPDGAGIVGVAFSPGGSKVAAACLDHRVLL